MMKEMKRKNKAKHLLQVANRYATTWYGVMILGGLLGFIFFVSLYGLKVLDPTFVDWLLFNGDIKQHYMGWEFFRNENWAVPLGSIESLAYPFGISLTYTDSIPLMAFVLKIFSPLLPESFQYIGLWGMLCFVLQGALAALIMRRWTKNIFVILICAAVFVISPVLIARMFIHTALASQWVVLLAIWVMLERRRFDSVKKQIAVWSGVFALAMLIHPYFLPMVALPFVISVILQHRRWLPTLAKAFMPPFVAVVLFWIIGGFVVQDASMGGLGGYGLNLNSLFNPIGWSRFLSTMPNYSATWETINYLGIGVLGLLPVVLYIFLRQFKNPRDFIDLRKKIKPKHILVIVSVLGLTMAAVSPNIQFGSHLLLHIPVPDSIERYWAIFRASARLFWVVYYLIIIGVLAYVVTSWGRRSQALLAAFLAIFAAAQFLDVRLSEETLKKQQDFTTINQADYAYRSRIKPLTWDSVVGDRQHLVYLDKIDHDDFFELVDVALKYNLTMNTGYFARSPEAAILAYQIEQKDRLLAGNADVKNNLYVTKNKALVRQLQDHGYAVKFLYGFYVIDKL